MPWPRLRVTVGPCRGPPQRAPPRRQLPLPGDPAMAKSSTPQAADPAQPGQDQQNASAPSWRRRRPRSRRRQLASCNSRPKRHRQPRPRPRRRSPPRPRRRPPSRRPPSLLPTRGRQPTAPTSQRAGDVRQDQESAQGSQAEEAQRPGRRGTRTGGIGPGHDHGSADPGHGRQGLLDLTGRPDPRRYSLYGGDNVAEMGPSGGMLKRARR